MQRFTVGDIENVSGVRAHTLRRWEQRYGLLAAAQSKERKRRYYNEEDLKRILRVAFLYQNGWKSSQIIGMSWEAVGEEVGKIRITKENVGTSALKLLEAAIDFNEPGFNAVLDELAATMGLQEGLTRVVFPLLHKIALVWGASHALSTLEPFCKNLIRQKIIALTDRLPSVAQESPAVVLFSPDGEEHEVALLFINYLLKTNGWRTIYLGCNITLQHLIRFKDDKSTALFFVRVTDTYSAWNIDTYLEEMCRAFSDKKIAASGPALHSLQRRFVNLVPLRSDEELYAFARGTLLHLGST